MTAVTIADIAMNGTAKQISSTSVVATVVILSATGSNAARVGDKNVGAGRGVVLFNDFPLVLMPVEFAQGGYDLSQMYVYGTAGETVSITYFV